MNYFTIKNSTDIGNGFVLLTLGHDYGSGPDIRIPVTGEAKNFPPGGRIEITVAVV